MESVPISSLNAPDEQKVREAIETAQSIHSNALAWILARVDVSGSSTGSDIANGYYRLPWALAVAGRMGEATAVLNWIEANALEANGDLRLGAPQTEFVNSVASYPLAQIAIGAWLTENYALALRIMSTLRSSFTDTRTGGIYAERPEVRTSYRQDLISTCQFGLAAIVTGQRTEADNAFNWLGNLWDAQPDLPNKLYTSWTPSGLMTEVPSGSSTWNLFTDFHVKHQAFYNPGLAAAFLGRYFSFSGEAQALELAHKFLDLTVGGSELQFDHHENMQICKFAWGAGVVLDIDRSAADLGGLLRMVAWYQESQLPDGSWHPSSFLIPSPGPADDMGKTAEHLLHLSTIIRSLAGFRARSIGDQR